MENDHPPLPAGARDRAAPAVKRFCLGSPSASSFNQGLMQLDR
jgi:hypothetical protein